jgi:protein-S-isoprenylcysteine O-methyltransferase Ste14
MKCPDAYGYLLTTTVAQRGLYAVVRHPQYLGYDFLAWGLATFFLYWGTILPAIAVTVGFAIQARAEEDHLLDRFPDAYRAYRRTVPRFGLLTGLVRYLRRRRGRGDR